MDMRITPLRIKIMLESNPPKSIMLVWRLTVGDLAARPAPSWLADSNIIGREIGRRASTKTQRTRPSAAGAARRHLGVGAFRGMLLSSSS